MKKSILAVACAALMGVGAAVTAASVRPAAVTQAASNVITPEDKQAFIDKIATHAQACANSWGLYPSVQIAQAALESGWGQSQLAEEPYYNLFGMKANDNWDGPSVTMPTQEWDANAKEYIWIDAPFRRYAGFYDSFTDNAKKLRLGVSFDPVRYRGTWVENTTSYHDATDWLQGRYATSITYTQMLDKIIADYKLTQYDPVIQPVNKAVAIAAPEAALYASHHTYAPLDRALAQGTRWRVYAQTTINDQTWYNLGGKQWVQAQATNTNYQTTPFTGVGVVDYVPGYAIAIWDSPLMGQFTGKRLKHGTAWKVFQKAVINGTTWYNLGGNQWLNGKYVKLR